LLKMLVKKDMICLKCKKEIEEGSAFCNWCGASQAPTMRKPKQRGNGEGTVFKRGKTYTAMIVKYKKGRKKSKSKGGFKLKKDALDYLPELKKKFEVRYKNQDITFAELHDEWQPLAYENMSDSRKIALNTAYKRCEPLYEKRWVDILPRDMQDAVNAAAGSYYTRKDMKNLISLMAKHAIKNEIFDRNYALSIDLPELIEEEIEPFSVDEIIKLWQDYQAGNDFTGYAIIMMFTGLSIGELESQQTEKINFEEHYMRGGRKTKKRKETEIVFPAFLEGVIRKLAGEKMLLEMSEYVFRKEFDLMCIRAGARPLKPHSCRHTYSTMLAKKEVQAAVQQEMNRHTNYKTTKRYTKIDRETKIEAAEKIASVLLLTNNQQDAESVPKHA